ncbi:MAG: copper-translocating P-type ATPase [Ignavibacteria bacterium]|nr:copper-translocating P-type ATPase [Ignavibacteria bacterium]
MTCASCVLRIEKALKKVDGVGEAVVNLATENASVKFDSTRTEKLKLKEAIEKVGYKVIEAKASAEDEDEIDEAAQLRQSVYQKLTNELIFSAALTIPISIFSMLVMYQPFYEMLNWEMGTINKILLLATTPVLIYGGERFFIIAWTNAKHFSADMNTLVAVGTGSAYLYSLIATLFPWLISIHGHADVYFDTTAVIITLILFGRWLEARAKSKTTDAIKKLIGLKPKTANVIRNGNEVTIPLLDIILDDIVVVRPGEKIAADGIISDGSSSIDESMITGESIPVEKTIGNKVIGGTINKFGSINFKVTELGKKSILGQIVKLMEDAQASKAPIQSLADKIASVFVPIVIGIAIITFFAWTFLSDTGFQTALINFVAVLIIACPCALGLATPTAIMVGTGIGANNGILIKSAESLELSHKITDIVLDKTGTITEGNPVVTDFIQYYDNEIELLQIIKSIENKSEHPIAKAVVEYGKSKTVEWLDVDSFEVLSGFGVKASVRGKTILIGNDKLMVANSIETSLAERDYSNLSNQGKTLVYVAIENRLASLIAIADQIKPTSKSAIADLRKMNINVTMLTGDNERTASSIASEIGIKNYIAQVLPADKSSEVKNLQQKGKIIAMVGDGVNDAPAISQADVGIAMSSGTDVAMEAADVTLMKNDLRDVVKAIKLSHLTIKAIKQNLFWAFIYNVIGIPLAAIGMLNPIIAAGAMAFSSVSVVMNSLRIRRKKI